MNTKVIGAGIVLAAAVALIVGRQAISRASATPPTTESIEKGTPAAAGPRVVLVANMGEADEECTCGEIIRAVRVAAQKGIATKEIDTRTSKDQAKQYNVRVVPTVLFLDGAGKEQHRYEGESSDTLKSVKRELDALTTKK